MKVSLNWIKDYVDLPQDMDLTRLAYDLTMSTVEVEGAEDLARRFDHMLVGRIVEVCPIPTPTSCRSAARPSAAVTSGISSAAVPTSARA